MSKKPPEGDNYVMPVPRIERREDLISRLAVLENDVHIAHGRLFGNGQPGEISALRMEIELSATSLRADMDRQFAIAEKERSGIEERNSIQYRKISERLIRLERIAWIGAGIFIGINLLREIPEIASLIHRMAQP